MQTNSNEKFTPQELAKHVYSAERSMPIFYCDVDELKESGKWAFNQISKNDLYNIGATAAHESTLSLPQDVSSFASSFCIGVSEDVMMDSYIATKLGVDPIKSIESLFTIYKNQDWPNMHETEIVMNSQWFDQLVHFSTYTGSQYAHGKERIHWDMWISQQQ